MSLPFVGVLAVFTYAPLWGWIMSFQKYSIPLGIFGSEFVGLSQFRKMFTDDWFHIVLRNTLAMSAMNLVTNFVGAILLALLLNEVRARVFKRTIQTITYIPHFVSWVVIASIITFVLSPDGGPLNELLLWLGAIDEPLYFFAKEKWFWVIHTLVGLWKELGWSTIIYLAVLAGINPALYEAAEVDGAGRFRKMWHISLPGLLPTAVILLILNTGNLLSTGYESQMLLGNSLVMEYSQVLDLYALDYAMKIGDYSYGTAISMFKSVVSITLVLLVNALAKRIGQSTVL
ncbi:carbohydrate ABC transporter membrane protein 1, CUT1 family [Paenibacillus sp. UNCCL117]|uniref:ABC transporter permease n=1 Tax=unclassified Paenibacillus TaxID=185978 RepID=UPI00087FCDA5|nr:MULTISPECIES: ABC transporter permease subunit [unclassified Paenibacillus]SDD24605.1 carbohydrate ABC transporter membrane protein 1, CUT1 family [Paenibacillus sp. cl123]SFW41453.1 carbohydrate ABC transporter membrane protein 1, CUT1 family [Paenibacillus sp. UNCCL117]